MKAKTRLQKAIVISLILCLFASITLTVGAAFSDSYSFSIAATGTDVTPTDPIVTPTDPIETPTDVDDGPDGILGFFADLIARILAFFEDLFGGIIC